MSRVFASDLCLVILVCSMACGKHCIWVILVSCRISLCDLRSQSPSQIWPCRPASLLTAADCSTKVPRVVIQPSKHSLLTRWVTPTTGLRSMISPLLLLLGSPGARQCCSPWQGTQNREQPCVLWASSCCCCSFWWFAVSVSCWILTAACHHHHGQTTRRGWTKDSLIMQLCKYNEWCCYCVKKDVWPVGFVIFPDKSFNWNWTLNLLCYSMIFHYLV